MKRGLLFGLVFVMVASLSFSFSSRATNATDDAYKKLKNKYPWESIYVMPMPMLDMADSLNNPDKFDKLAEKPPGRVILSSLRKFLNDTHEISFRSAVAFLQLNLTLEKAGYKRLSDKRGAIQPIAWSDVQFRGIAVFCDRSLTQFNEFDELIAGLSSGNIKLAKGLEVVKAMGKDPYIPAAKVVQMMGSYRKLIAKRPGELKKMKENKADMYKAILRFQKEFDKASGELLQDKKIQDLLKDIQSKKLDNEIQQRLELNKKINVQILKGVKIPGLNPQRMRTGRPLGTIIEAMPPSVNIQMPGSP